MRKVIITLTVLAVLLLLAACESGGKFRVVNRTSFPLYATIGAQDEVTIPGGEEHTWEISTDKQHIFNPGVEKVVPVSIIGETYHTYDEGEESYTDSTTVTIKVGQTLSAYISPNRASFKVVNNSSQGVQRVLLYKHNFVAASFVEDLGSLTPGEMKFLRVDYATANNNFYYYATVEMADNTVLTYGGDTTILEKDQQFLITLTDPEEIL
ncbi:MAG: hypothetical protein K0B87_08410 [Candidatus Syntrophosphaera sp.]|nr:hypothetical protein [Candidatus Syntrophosphaera sp.]